MTKNIYGFGWSHCNSEGEVTGSGGTAKNIQDLVQQLSQVNDGAIHLWVLTAMPSHQKEAAARLGLKTSYEWEDWDPIVKLKNE